ncbi:hypothetical protein ABZZ79_02835 [Streptomyces sp. NPDC006458]|uniref:hypothetical protein n=1 Tax=Streptomyces sp. NPDC006458 TaxID=3154302 RepID=UPI0033A979E6
MQDLRIEVERVPADQWFAPYIEDHEWGCTFYFYSDDITAEGAEAFASVFTQQALRWKPRTPDAPRGPRIPIWMETDPDMERGCAIVVDDQPTHIRYIVREGLIKQRSADAITRHQSERSPDWERRPARYIARLRAV